MQKFESLTQKKITFELLDVTPPAILKLEFFILISMPPYTNVSTNMLIFDRKLCSA